jgi:hypothetical protein
MRVPFILLRDFSIAYDSLQSRISVDASMLEERFAAPMIDCLKSVVNPLEIYELARIRELTDAAVPKSHFIVALEEGVYFSGYDYRVELTRASSKYSDKHGEYRVARVDAPSLIQQVADLHREYLQDGDYKPIVLCDDGIGTGGSLRTIVEIFSQMHVEISKIVVLVNPSNIESIGDIDVETIIRPEHSEFIWLSERDLYWGLPRSGLSLFRDQSTEPAYGIPYTIDANMIERRIELHADEAIRFRECNLKINADFWDFLGAEAGREIFVDDCKRISFLTELFTEEQLQVADVIRAVNFPSFTFPDSCSAITVKRK